MKKFGLIGYPLTHSFSKKYFTEKFINENFSDYSFQLFPIPDIAEFPIVLKSEPSLCGLNVTIPYKEKVINYLDELDKNAKEIGAVNTIKIKRFENKIITKGFNTDVYGFKESIKPLLKEYHTKALILGTGGASKAVACALKDLNIIFLFVSRNPKKENQISYNDLTKEILDNFLVIVNSTPVGMYPDNSEKPPIPYQWLTSKHLLYDLIYNPEETNFLKEGKQKGAITKNGIEMFHLQAEKSWEIWNNNIF